MLVDACCDVAVAASKMAAAELLAQRGGARDPMAPLYSVHSTRDGDGDGSVRLLLGLGLLQSGRICAEDACNSVECCVVRSWTAFPPAGPPGSPWRGRRRRFDHC
ncbi:hypothetical protein ACP70R_031131 [Stipagrostis hirtigluma subsp. patula]